MRIRPFTAADAEPTLALFRHTVKTVNRRDYSEEEVAAWLREEDVTPDMWLDSFTGKVAFVAIDDNGALTGFVDCKPQTGLIDRLFVAAHRQGEGIGSALLAQAQAAVERSVSTFTVYASLTARTFFERSGYTVVTAESAPVRAYDFVVAFERLRFGYAEQEMPALDWTFTVSKR